MSVSFKVPVTPWPSVSHLTDPKNDSDLVTAKLLVWNSLEPSPTGWLKTASSVPGLHRTAINFIRWRLHINVASNSALTAAHYRDYVTRYRHSGLEGMLEVSRRAARLVDAHRQGLLELPLGDRGFFFHVGIEELLGLNFNQTPPEAIEVLMAYAKELGIPFQRSERKRIGPQPRAITKTAAYAQLAIWKTLWGLNDALQHDPFQYHAHASPGELANAYSGWAQDGRKTPDAPELQTSWLIDAAIRLVFDDVVDSIFVLYSEINGRKVGNGEVFEAILARFAALGFGPVSGLYCRSRWQTEPKQFPTIREIVFRLLATAAVICIAAFGARRDSELQALRADCIQRDEYGQLWLQCWIAKNRRELTKIPTNHVVERAVEVLNRLGELAAEHGEPEWLLQYFDVLGPVEFKFNEALRQFSAWVAVPPLDDGKYWEFASHQFRKFFAVTYQWRFYFPDFGALNHHLRQTIDVTAGYAKMRGAATLRQYDATKARMRSASPDWIELDRATALREEEESFIVHILRGMLDGSISPGGAKGKTLATQLRTRFSEQIRLSTQESDRGALNGELAKVAKDLHMRTHSEGHSICCCGSSAKDLETAGCLIERQRR